MSKWFHKYRYNPGRAKMRLFCFPYAGGSAVIFDGWQKKLPENVDIFAIQAPGRGPRFGEEPIGDLESKVKAIRKEIAPYLDIPFMFLGHSNGAMLAFELTRELQRDKALWESQLKQRYWHLVLSGKRAIHLPKTKDDMHHLPFDDFIDRLKKYNGTPKEILEHRELMELYMPVLRADFSLSETLKYNNDIKSDVPTTVYYGAQDVDVPEDDVKAWQELIEPEISFTKFAGDHFFINSQREEYLAHLNQLLRKQFMMHL